MIVDDLGKTISGWVKRSSGTEYPTTIDPWSKACPQLEAALVKYDCLDSKSLPETAWFGASKTKYQQELGTMIDAVIKILEMSGAAPCREAVRVIQQEITDTLQEVAA